MKEFSGKRSDISPRLLINIDKEDSVQSFFLILGLIFNDLKGLIFFQKFIEDNYRKPDASETSAHAGEYNGLIAQADKLIIATVGEFFNFIEKNRPVLTNIKFLLLVKELAPENQLRWTDLTKMEMGSTVLSKIARIRSNVTFHYDHSMEELRRGFINSFFQTSKELPQHKRAYYSLGDSMENSRIYYSDAAAQDYINSLLNIDERKQIRFAVDEMNHTIQGLLRIYLKSIKK